VFCIARTPSITTLAPATSNSQPMYASVPIATQRRIRLTHCAVDTYRRIGVLCILLSFVNANGRAKFGARHCGSSFQQTRVLVTRSYMSASWAWLLSIRHCGELALNSSCSTSADRRSGRMSMRVATTPPHEMAPGGAIVATAMWL
jgi:hypothetical protein